MYTTVPSPMLEYAMWSAQMCFSEDVFHLQKVTLPRAAHTKEKWTGPKLEERILTGGRWSRLGIPREDGFSTGHCHMGVGAASESKEPRSPYGCG